MLTVLEDTVNDLWGATLSVHRTQSKAMTGVLSSPSFAPKQMKPIHNDVCFFTGQTED